MVDFNVMNDTILGTLADAGAATVTIDGDDVPAIYDSRHYAIETGEGSASDLITSIAVKDAIAAGLTLEVTEIVARGVTYVASARRPLGEGMTTVILKRAP